MHAAENRLENQSRPKKLNKVWMVLILGSLTAFGPLSMDMYLPALPLLAVDLNTTASLAQLSLTACLLGLAGGQLVFGPLSDIQGRRRPLVITLTIYTLVSIFAAFSPNIWVFIGLRFIQGFTGAAGIVIARASARDMYTGKDLTKFIALLALVNGAAPIIAPIFGGALLNWVSWHVVFLILGAIGLVMFLAVVFTLEETLPPEQRSEGNVLAIVGTFLDLLRDRVFIGIALAQSFVMMSMFAYISGAPFVLQNMYDISPQQFSIVFAANGLGIIIAAQVTGKLAVKLKEETLLFAGMVISVIGSCLLLLAVFAELSFWLLIVALFLVVSSVGMVNTTSFSLGMQRQGKAAGSASAFLGILPFAGGALVSPLVGIAGDHTAVPMAIVIFACSVLALVLYWSLARNKR